MKRILFPDPLVWQAGLEYGVQAVGSLVRSGVPVECFLSNVGPMLEAVALVIHQERIGERAHFVRDPIARTASNDIAVFPRVASLDQRLLLQAARAGFTVITSDPSIPKLEQGIRTVTRRDWKELELVLKECLTTTTA